MENPRPDLSSAGETSDNLLFTLITAVIAFIFFE